MKSYRVTASSALCGAMWGTGSRSCSLTHELTDYCMYNCEGGTGPRNTNQHTYVTTMQRGDTDFHSCHFFFFATHYSGPMLTPTGIISLPGKDSINTESRLEKMKPPRKWSLSDSRAGRLSSLCSADSDISSSLPNHCGGFCQTMVMRSGPCEFYLRAIGACTGTAL